MAIPRKLPQKTYMLEYLPGTYGDFICGLISYSIDEFYDHHDEVGLDWKERYWKVEAAELQRNRYVMSLRGSGYEHVEYYTDFMLSHHVFLRFPNVYKSEKTKIMFNTHHSVVDFSFRTTKNKLTDTDCKFIVPKMSFYNIFQCVANEYFSSFAPTIDKENGNWVELFERFIHKLTLLDRIEEEIPSEKKFRIDNIRDISPEDIEYYGKVDVKKFEEYKQDYCNRKLDMLEWKTKRLHEKIRILEPEKYRYFEHAYDTRQILSDN